MRCDEWSERLSEYLTGEQGEPERRDTEEHLRSCAVCREEIAGLRETWDALGRLPADAPPERMRGRFREALAAERLRGRARRRLPSAWPLHPAAALAVALALLAAGFVAGNALARIEAPAVEAPRYLLLIHDRPEGPGETAEQKRRAVEDFKRWAGSLARAGKLVGGEKLADAGQLLSAGPARDLPPGPGRIGGYFLIRAATPAEALEITRSCPHIARGGTVELRAIDPV